MPLTLSQLEAALKQFNVPIHEWGKGKARSLQDLFQEILQGESRLMIDDTGIFRRIEVVKMLISDASHLERGFLLQLGEFLPDGRYQPRSAERQNPSGSVKKDETFRRALFRELQEELQVRPTDIWELSEPLSEFEHRASPSYPGLVCLYVVHGFVLSLKGEAGVCQQDEFTKTQEDGTKILFKWG